MSDEPQQTPEPTGTPAEPQVQIGEAELETIKARASQFDKLEEEAQGLGFSDFDEMQDELVDSYSKKLDAAEAAKSRSATKSATTPKPATNTQSDVQIAELTKKLEESNKRQLASDTMSATSYLESQFVLHQMTQDKLSEEQRSSNTKEQLYDIIRGPMGTMVREQAKKSGGNLCAAADKILTIQKAMETKEGSAPATAPAAVAATQLGEGVPPKPEPKEGDRSPNDIAADDICPDDDFVLQT